MVPLSYRGDHTKCYFRPQIGTGLASDGLRVSEMGSTTFQPTAWTAVYLAVLLIFPRRSTPKNCKHGTHTSGCCTAAKTLSTTTLPRKLSPWASRRNQILGWCRGSHEANPNKVLRRANPRRRSFKFSYFQLFSFCWNWTTVKKVSNVHFQSDYIGVSVEACFWLT